MLAAYTGHQMLLRRHAASEAAKSQAESVVASLKRQAAPSHLPPPLPAPVVIDAVVADVGRFAQAGGVRVASVKIDSATGNSSALAQARLAVRAQGDYAALKHWLAELLARHHSLTLASASLRAGGDSRQLEGVYDFTLYTLAEAPARTTLSVATGATVSSRQHLEDALSDPFATLVLTPPPASAQPTPAAKKIEPPPPAPTAPPLNLKYAGRATTPDGAIVVFATLGNDSISLIPGMTLANGYKVEKVGERSIEFLYAPLNATARLDISAPPSFEIR